MSSFIGQARPGRCAGTSALAGPIASTFRPEHTALENRRVASRPHSFLGHVVSYNDAFSCVAHSCRWTNPTESRTCALRGISQEELAHRSGLSRTGMGLLETGKR